MSKIKSVRGDENDCTLFKISPLNAINFRHLSSCGTWSKCQHFATLAGHHDIKPNISTVYVHAIAHRIPNLFKAM